MYIEMACPGCGRKLRVATEHAGKAARCPLCNTIYNVPGSASPTESPAESSPAATPLWQLKTPEGQVYGPVSREILDQWMAEGRISAECSLMGEPDGVWQAASDVYPVLRPVIVRPTPQPVYDNPVIGEGPIGTGSNQPGRVRVMNAHRGPLILALGIMSWAFGCPIFGVAAWVMGSGDIRDMRRGTMDPRGLGLTQAGQIVGMINALVFLAVLVIVLFVALVLFVIA